MHRFGDVLELTVPQVVELELQLALDLVAHVVRDADAAGLGQALETRRNVHAVSVEPLVLRPHLAHVHADAELHRAARGHRGVARLEHPLDLGRCPHSIGRGRELGEEVVAGEVHHAAAVLAHERTHEMETLGIERKPTE